MKKVIIFLTYPLDKNNAIWYNFYHMNKRRYIKYSDIYRKLENFCRESRLRGCMLLPNERELAERFETYRPTLSKAIRQAIDNGLLSRTGKRTEILSENTLGSYHTVLFITVGCCDSILWNAYERLYLTLKLNLENLGANVLLYLHHYTNPHNYEDFLQIAEKADVILLTILDDADRSTEKIIAYLKDIQSRKKVIALADPLAAFFENSITIDNYAVGSMAAKSLMAADCRKPFCIAYHKNAEGLGRRVDGFVDEWKKKGVMPAVFYGNQREKNCYLKCAKAAVDALQDGVDGLFVITDEQISVIYSDLLAQNAVPGKMRLITFNGSKEGLRCKPPITSISHGTQDVVDLIVEYLRDTAEENTITPVHKKIRPKIYLNSTLGVLKHPHLLDTFLYKPENTSH